MLVISSQILKTENTRILKTYEFKKLKIINFSKRLTAESWFILSRPKEINRSDGESFPVVYRSLL